MNFFCFFNKFCLILYKLFYPIHPTTEVMGFLGQKNHNIMKRKMKSNVNWVVLSGRNLNEV